MSIKTQDVAGDGLFGYLAQPQAAGKGAVLIVPTIFGVNAFARGFAETLAHAGLTGSPLDPSSEDGTLTCKVGFDCTKPFGKLDAARQAPLKIDNALITPVPSPRNGWMVAVTLFVFMAFFAIGPGVCVWLALSELMPTRIRSNGMSIALVLNQAVSTTIAAIFLPTVGKYGYSTMFFGFAACTVIYFITATWFLPETKGKTLEEIEAYFEGASS